MDPRDIRRIFFALFTGTLLLLAMAALKILITFKLVPLLFCGLVIGLLLIMHKGTDYMDSGLYVVAASVLGFGTTILIYERTTLDSQLYVALFFSIALATPILLIKLREKLFGTINATGN